MQHVHISPSIRPVRVVGPRGGQSKQWQVLVERRPRFANAMETWSGRNAEMFEGETFARQSDAAQVARRAQVETVALEAAFGWLRDIAIAGETADELAADLATLTADEPVAVVTGPDGAIDVTAAYAAGYGVVREHSGTEDGYLYYVTHNGSRVPNAGGWNDAFPAWHEACDLARLDKLTAAERAAVETMRSDTPAPADYAATVLEDGRVVETREARPRERNDESEYGYSRAVVLASIRRDYIGTSAIVVECDGTRYDDVADIPEPRMAMGSSYDVDVMAAKLAREAADAFDFDAESEDASSAAQRAADILRDLAADDVPAFLLRVFGMPTEERHAARELRARWSHGVPEANDTATVSEWRMLRAQARAEAGYVDVARELVLQYEAELQARAFAGHGAFTDERGRKFSESTNLNAWREARAAFAAVNETAGHAFGGMSLDGYRAELDKLAAVTLDAAAEAVRWAAWNDAHAADYADAAEHGMPRAE